MTRRAAAAKLMTVEEYLAFERASEERHEYFRGEVFAMSGASLAHTRIAGNIAGALWSTLRDGPCEALPMDMRVRVPATGLYTYPDVSVVCGGAELEDAHHDTLLNPRVIFEVLSESTESYDRGRKFDNYRTIPTLLEYVLVSQTEALVEHYARQKDGTWVLRVLRAGDVLALPAVGCEIAVDEIYLRVFEPTAPPGVTPER
jgi:Uma2 family endonuclease